MRDSLFYSSIRVFLLSLFTVVGLCVGFFVVILLISAISTTTTEPEMHYKIQYAPNAKGERKVLSSTAPVVLKLNVAGVIGMESLSMESVRQQLVESREGDLKDNRVKAILLNINSPGGTVVDSDGIYHAIKAYKEQYKVPVYAFVDGMCASGGMYVACAADKVFATDVSIVGSVGVLMPTFFNFSQLLNEKLNIQTLTLIAGKEKDELNPLRPWKPNEGASIQELINHYYQEFVDIVTKNRPEVNREKLIQEYGAKIFDAKKAQEIGFVNASGATLRDTLKLLLKEIGVEDDYYQVVELHKKTWYSSLLSESPILSGKVVHQLQLPEELDPKLSGQFLYLYRP